MQFSVPDNALWIVMVVALVIQFLKEFDCVGSRWAKFLPYIAVALGWAGCWVNAWIVSAGPVAIPDIATGGIAIGLMATGSYEAFKNIGVKKI